MGTDLQAAETSSAVDSSQRRKLIVIVIVVVVALAALVTRLTPFLFPGQIYAVREYDDGVMLGGAMAILSGQLPYADFIYLHPPSSLLMLLPIAGSATFLGEPGAMALARGLAVLVGVANTVLIAVLLARRGRLAMLVGAGLYAAWPVAVSTERTILLEPVLVLGLLVALLLIRQRTTIGVVAAAVCLGLATTVKVWAIVDVIIVAVMVAAMMGRRMFVRYLLAAAITVTTVCLPFFLVDPPSMWSQVIAAQLTRAGTPASLPARAESMSLAEGVHAIDALIPWPIWVALFAGMIVIGLIPLAADIFRRRTPTRWAEASWWAIILIAHALIILFNSGYFYHYAVWFLAPLCLSVGYSVGGVGRGLWRVPVLVTLIGVLVMTTSGALRHPGDALQSRAELAAWASTHTCIWGDASQLIAADALRANFANSCSMDIDKIGAFLVLGGEVARETDDQTESAIWRDRQWGFALSADGVLVPAERLPDWFTDQQRAEFTRMFVEESVLDGVGLWSRVAD